MRSSRHAVPPAVLSVALVLAGCATTDKAGAKETAAAKPGDTVVELVGLQFKPATVEVPVGRRVRWQWTDSVVHNVVSPQFPSSQAQGGGAYAVTFDRAGTYAYRCSLHTGMDGTVVVTP